ncbi:MAG TPA: outer membrane protein assembly factor BamE [Gaiellales bacterium]|nr:outer membrane protein assembly factor BamE [Gaiellales bacterium]
MKIPCARSTRPVLAALCLMGLVACTANVSTHGHVLNPDDLAQIQPGVTNREEVARLLGSPSTVGTFDQERWFYISQRNEVMSFYKADITKQDVVAIDFDGNGVVSDVHTHGLEMAQAIQPDPNKTRTMGNELTFVQQVLGNIGRFNAPPLKQNPGSAGGF